MEFIQAGIFGDILTWLGGTAVEAIGYGALIVFGFVWLFKKFIKPIINTMQKKDFAMLLIQVADDVTDELVLKYPDAKWDDWLDEAVDKVKDIIGDINPAVATRVTKAAIARKKLK